MNFIDRVKKWGTSFVITLPKKQCDESGISKNTRVQVKIEKKDEVD